MSGDTVTDGAGVEWRQDPQTGRWWWRDSKGEWQWKWHHFTPKSKTNPSRRNSVSSSEGTKSIASTASTAATLAVSEEYKELQRMQQKMSEIEVLQDRKTRGAILSKYEESTIRRWGEFYYAPVMAKHRSDKFKTGKGKGSA